MRPGAHFVDLVVAPALATRVTEIQLVRHDQHTATLEGNARLMFGPHGELAPGVSASLLAGGGVGGRGRVDTISAGSPIARTVVSTPAVSPAMKAPRPGVEPEWSVVDP
jgi:hypothetical protein